MAQGNFKFNIGFNVDKSGLNDLKASLYNIQNLSPKELIGIMPIEDAKKKLKQVQAVAKDLENALSESFNPTLNTYNIDTFKKKLSESGRTLADYRTELLSIGAKGQAAFIDLTESISSTKLPLQETHNLLKSMGQTLTNTIKWSIASNAVNTITGSVQKAWSFTKQLDTSLNDIMIVTGKSADEMERFAQKANTAAKNLGATTNQYAQAALIYYQQGLAEEDVMSRSDVTVKAANVTGQSTQAVSEQLTAIWNGYKTSAAEAELYIDKVSAVAATTAADLEELSTGMSKVASAANAMGVDIDQLNAQLATIVSVTRQDSAVVGTALKTIYSRMGDLMVDGEDEFGTKLGEVSSSLKTMGINVLDAQGNLRDMGIVIEEVAAKWNTWTEAQQQAAAVAIAGKRQYNNLIALFENWDMYESAKSTSENSVGTLQKQQETYLDSLDARFDKLQATAEDLYLSLLDADSFKAILDIITAAVDKLGDFADAVGGGGNILLSLIPILTRVFSGTVADGTATFIMNMRNAETSAAILKNTLKSLDEIKASGISGYEAKLEAMRENMVKLAAQGTITHETFNLLDDELTKYTAKLKETIKAEEEASTTAATRAGVIQTAFKAEADNKSLTSYFEKAVEQGQEFAAKGLGKNEVQEQLFNSQWYADAETAFNRIDNLISQVSINTKEWIKSLGEGSQEEVKTLTSMFDNLKRQTEELRNTGAVTGAASGLSKRREGWIGDWLEKAQSEVDASGKASAKTIEKLEFHIDKYQEELSSMGIHSSKVLKDIREQFELLATGGIAKNSQELDNLEENIKKALEKPNLEAQIQKWTNLASNIGMAGAAAKNLFNIFKIWNNEELSVGEKLEQTFTNLTSSVMMLAPTLSMLTKLKKQDTAATIANTVAENMAADVILINTGKLSAKAVAEKWLATITDELSDEQKEHIQKLVEENQKLDENTQKILINATAKAKAKKMSQGENPELPKETTQLGFWKSFGEGAKGERALRKTGVSNVKQLASGGKDVAQQAALASGTSLSSTGAAIGSAVAAAAPYVAIAAAIAAIIYGTYKWVDAINSTEKKAKEAADQALAASREQLAQVQASYNTLESSIKSLESAKDSLDKLVEGTAEWKKALIDCNTEVIKLINQYPELTNYIERAADGSLSISTEGLEKVQEKQLEYLNKANAQVIQASMMAENANIEYLANEYAEKEVYGSQGMADATPWLAALSALPTNIFGAIVAAIGTAYTGEAKEEAVKDELLNGSEFQAAMEKYATMGEGIFDSYEALAEALDIEGPLNDVQKALVDNAKETKALAAEYAKQQAAKDLNLTELGRSIIGENALDGEAWVIGNKAQVSQEDINAVKQELRGGDAKDKAAAAIYLESIGLSADNIIGAKGANKVQYKDANDNEQELDMDDVFAAIAGIRKQESAGQYYEDEFQAVFNSFISALKDDNLNNIFSSILGSDAADFSSLTKEELNKLQNAFIKVSEETWDDLAKASGKSTEDIQKNFTDATSIWQREWEEAINAIPASYRAEFSTLFADTSALSLRAYQEFADMYAVGLRMLGDEAISIFEKVLGKKGLGAISDDLLAEFVNIDWTADGAPTEFNTLIASYGKNLPIEDLTAFANLLKLISGYYNDWDLGKAESQHKAISDIVGSLKEIGDTISAETYKDLGPELSNYFVRMADGTYALTVAAEDFAKAAAKAQRETAKSDFLNNLKNYEDALAQNTELREKREWLNEIQPKYQDLLKGQSLTLEYALQNPAALQLLEEKLLPYLDDANIVRANDLREYGIEKYANISIYQKQIKQFLEDNPILVPLEGIELERYDRLNNKLTTEIAELQAEGAELTDTEKADYLSKIADSTGQYLASATSIQELQSIWKNPVVEEAIKTLSEADQKELNDAYQKYLKILEANKDRYNFEVSIADYLEIQADLLEREYKTLQDSAEAIVDKDIIYILDAQNANLRDQIELYKDIAAAKKATIQEQQEDLEKSFTAELFNNETGAYEEIDLLKHLGLQLEYDENGYITNLTEIGNEIEEFKNTNIDSLSSTSLAALDTFLHSDLENYNTVIQEYLDALDAVADKEKSILDNNAKKIQQIIDNKAKVKDLKLEYQDFQRSLLEDDNYAKIANTYLEEAKAIEEEALTFAARRDKLDADWAAQHITDAEYQAQLEALNQDAQEAVLALKEAEANVEDQLVSAIEARADAYDDYIEKIKTANDLYEKQIDLTALLYGEQSEEFFNASVDYYQQISNSYNDILTESMNAANKAWDTFNKLRTPVEKGGLGLSEEDDAYQAALEEATNAIQKYYDNLGEAVEAAQKAYFAIVDKQLNAFEYRMTSGLGLERLNERWEWQQRMADKYLDTTNRIYETSALAYEFDKAARSTSSLNAQKAINEAKEEELKILREKGKLTQYDLDRAKLRLEITQAEIALQEAQANKTQMRLTRGADGSYSYQYVADMNEIEDKKQELAELNNELYNLDKDKYRENLEEVYDIYAEYIEKIRKFGEDGIFSEDELEDLAQFRDYLKDLAGENSDVWTHLEGLMDRDGIYGKLVEGLTSDTFDTLENELTTALTIAGQIYTERMTELKNKLAEANGENGAGGLLEKFTEVNKATDTFIKKMDTAINGEDGLLNSLDDINGKYDDLATNLQGMIDILQTEIPKLIGENTIALETSRLGYIEGKSYNIEGDKSGLWEAYDLSDTGDKGSFKGIKSTDIQAGKYGSTVKLLKIAKDERGNMDLGLVQFEDGSLMWVDLSRHQLGDNYQGFDTGGYTGDWGSADGRLAMLHRKELVLNEEDTKNFLSGIDVLRSLDIAMLQTVGSMFDAMHFNHAVGDVVNNEVIEQVVHISASFPNATSRNEILEAFKQLNSLAGQQVTKNSRQ